MSILKSIIKKSGVVDLYRRNPYVRELNIWRSEQRRFYAEAVRRFREERPEHGSLTDYKEALRKHRVTYSEYMFSYEYWHLSEEERDKFISTSEMQCIYRKLGDKQVREVFHDKVQFLKDFHRFVHRKWARARDLTPESLRRMVESQDCIAKPIDGTRGDGIFKIRRDEVTDWEGLYRKCYDGNLLIEECIRACDELSDLHPASLNTIRVVTLSHNGRFRVFGALLRMGAHGSIIDNTHAGGVYAPINVETGTIDIPAIDGQNRHYEFHPDTHKPIKGFRIPHWDLILQTCREASQTIPNIRFAGWDLCINSDGKVEIIEGNHAPDFDGGMQAPLKIGVKRKLADAVREVMGVDPLKYISVWSKPTAF